MYVSTKIYPFRVVWWTRLPADDIPPTQPVAPIAASADKNQDRFCMLPPKSVDRSTARAHSTHYTHCLQRIFAKIVCDCGLSELRRKDAGTGQRAGLKEPGFSCIFLGA